MTLFSSHAVGFKVSRWHHWTISACLLASTQTFGLVCGKCKHSWGSTVLCLHMELAKQRKISALGSLMIATGDQEYGSLMTLESAGVCCSYCFSATGILSEIQARSLEHLEAELEPKSANVKFWWSAEIGTFLWISSLPMRMLHLQMAKPHPHTGAKTWWTA